MSETPEPPPLLTAQRMLDDLAARLARRFAGTFTRATLDRYVRESYSMLAATSRLPDVLPALTAKFATDRLAALARAQGLETKDVPEVLFVCQRNAGRSQMAAALLTLRADRRVRAHSAGTRPAAELELRIVEAMAQIGADLAAEYPKPVTDEIVEACDVVVALGPDAACPILPGKRYLEWSVPDPEPADEAEVGRIRDELDLLVADLLTTLYPDSGGSGPAREGGA
jgi:protein-tyrosine-phosphatase